MAEIACVECGSTVLQKKKNQRFCSPQCNNKVWRKENRDRSNELQRLWRDRNPDAVAKINAGKRKGWPTMTCHLCGKEFGKRMGGQKFCSPKCRDKVQRSRPNMKAKQLDRARRWMLNNPNKSREYYQKYNPPYRLKKMKAQPWLSLLVGARARAKKDSVPYTLDADWAKSKWTNRCEITGITFNPPEKRIGYKNRNLSPSIDRIEPSGPYTPENCRFVIWAVNCLKRDSPDDEMLMIAKAIVGGFQNRGDAFIALSLPG